MPARLILEDGTVYDGEAFGATANSIGEVVFNTSLTGYQEIATDPSYRFQIVVMTYPHIGNYGIEAAVAQNEQAQVAGFVVRDAIAEPSNAQSEMPLAEYFARNGISAIQGIDTRALTRQHPQPRRDARHDHERERAQRRIDRRRDPPRAVDERTRSRAARDGASSVHVRRAAGEADEAHRALRLRRQARHPPPSFAGRLRRDRLSRHDARGRNPGAAFRRRDAFERTGRSRAGDVRAGEHPPSHRQGPDLRHLPRPPASRPRARRHARTN